MHLLDVTIHYLAGDEIAIVSRHPSPGTRLSQLPGLRLRTLSMLRARAGCRDARVSPESEPGTAQ